MSTNYRCNKYIFAIWNELQGALVGHVVPGFGVLPLAFEKEATAENYLKRLAPAKQCKVVMYTTADPCAEIK